MASTTMFRAAIRSARALPRASTPRCTTFAPKTTVSSFSSTLRRRAGGEGAGHQEETYEEFTQRYADGSMARFEVGSATRAAAGSTVLG
jgi:hypothetical protein